MQNLGCIWITCMMCFNFSLWFFKCEPCNPLWMCEPPSVNKMCKSLWCCSLSPSGQRPTNPNVNPQASTQTNQPKCSQYSAASPNPPTQMHSCWHECTPVYKSAAETRMNSRQNELWANIHKQRCNAMQSNAIWNAILSNAGECNTMCKDSMMDRKPDTSSEPRSGLHLNNLFVDKLWSWNWRLL